MNSQSGGAASVGITPLTFLLQYAHEAHQSFLITFSSEKLGIDKKYIQLI